MIIFSVLWPLHTSCRMALFWQNSPSSLIIGREGLQRGDPESFPPVRRWRDGQDLIQESEESSKRAGREPHRWRAAGKAHQLLNICSAASNMSTRHSLTDEIKLAFHFLFLRVCVGDDRWSRQGWRRRSEPAGVPAHYEENLPVLKEVHDIRVVECWFLHVMLLIYLLPS